MQYFLSRGFLQYGNVTFTVSEDQITPSSSAVVETKKPKMTWQKNACVFQPRSQSKVY